MEETIRDPDIPFYDRLIEEPSAPNLHTYDYESALETAIKESLAEYETQQKLIETELYEKEKQERNKRFNDVKKICNRLIAVSEKDRPTLELFLYYISLYETDYINTINVEPVFYKQVFSILESTRLSKESIGICKNFITICDENI